ncbi:hypothetical protein AAIB48_09035 [Paraclostridium benzoelyticum]
MQQNIAVEEKKKEQNSITHQKKFKYFSSNYFNTYNNSSYRHKII